MKKPAQKYKESATKKKQLVEGQTKSRASKKKTTSKQNAQGTNIQDNSSEIRIIPEEAGNLMSMSNTDKVNCWLQSCAEEPESVLSDSSLELWREEAIDIPQERQANIFPEEFYKNLGIQVPVKKGAAQKKNEDDKKQFFAELNLDFSLKQKSDVDPSSFEDQYFLTGIDSQKETQTDVYFSTARTQSNFPTGYETETQSNLQTVTLPSSKQPYSTEYETETQSSILTGILSSSKHPFSKKYEIGTQSNLKTATQSDVQTGSQFSETESQTLQSSKFSNQQYKNKKRKAKRDEIPKPALDDSREHVYNTRSHDAKKRYIQQEQTFTESPVFKLPRPLKKGKKSVNEPKTSTRLYGDKTDPEEQSLPLSDIKPVKGKSKRKRLEGEEIKKSTEFKQSYKPQTETENKIPKPITSTRLFEDTDYAIGMTLIPSVSSIWPYGGKSKRKRLEGVEIKESTKIKQSNKPQTETENKIPKPITSTRLFEDTDYAIGMTLVPSLSSIWPHGVTEQTPDKPTKARFPKTPKKGLRVKPVKSELAEKDRKTDEKLEPALSAKDHARVSPLELDKCRVKTSTPVLKKGGGPNLDLEFDISSVNQDLSDESSIGLLIEPSSREVNSQEIVCPSDSETLSEKTDDDLFRKRFSRSFDFLRHPQPTNLAYNHDDKSSRIEISKSFYFGRQTGHSLTKTCKTSKASRVWVSKSSKLSVEDFQKLPVCCLPLIKKKKKKSENQNRIYNSDDKCYVIPNGIPIDILCRISKIRTDYSKP